MSGNNNQRRISTGSPPPPIRVHEIAYPGPGPVESDQAATVLLESIVTTTHFRGNIAAILVAATVTTTGIGTLASSAVASGDERRGGPVIPQPPVGAPIVGLDATQTDLFFEGKALYSLPIPVEDGLGPVFNKSNVSVQK